MFSPTKLSITQSGQCNALFKKFKSHFFLILMLCGLTTSAYIGSIGGAPYTSFELIDWILWAELFKESAAILLLGGALAIVGAGGAGVLLLRPKEKVLEAPKTMPIQDRVYSQPQTVEPIAQPVNDLKTPEPSSDSNQDIIGVNDHEAVGIQNPLIANIPITIRAEINPFYISITPPIAKSFFYMAVNRIRGFLIEPKKEWQTIRNENNTAKLIYLNYALPFTILVIIFQSLSIIFSALNSSKDLFGSFLVAMIQIFMLPKLFVESSVLVLSIFIVSYFLHIYVKRHTNQISLTNMVTLLTYSLTPFWFLSIFSILPGFAVTSWVAGWGAFLYLFYIGCDSFLKFKDHRRILTLACLVGILILNLSLSAVRK